MDKKEFRMFAMALKTYYHREDLLPNSEAMELWFRELSDIPYDVAESALRKWVAVNKWSPSIADIRAMAVEVTKGEIPDWSDGWEQVLKSIRYYGSYRANEAIGSLDRITQQTVKRLGYAELCRSTNIAVERANFRMIYEQIAAREKKNSQMQPGLQAIINKLQSENRKELRHDDSKGISASGKEVRYDDKQ